MLQTSVQIKGVLDGKEEICNFTHDEGPDAIFRGRTARELFLQSVPNPGCSNVQDRDIHVHIDVRRQCSFGMAGFTENDPQEASRKARELKAKSDEELAEEGTPDPIELLTTAVKAILEHDEKTAFALADTFEFFAKVTLGKEVGQGTGKEFMTAAAKMAARIVTEK